jgi:hypothetical protein
MTELSAVRPADFDGGTGTPCPLVRKARGAVPDEGTRR